MAHTGRFKIEHGDLLLPAAEGDDDGAVQDADENRTTRAAVIVTVAVWSSPCHGPTGQCASRRRHGGARMRTHGYPAGA